MATIQVYKHGTDTVLGKGDGTIDKTAKTATINTWEDKAGLQAQTMYKLKSGGKVYEDATCTAVGLPATFSGVT
jgi:hypothetical protein